MRLSALLLLFIARACSQLAARGAYNVIWLTPTLEDNTTAYAGKGGMPLGNGDTQALAWANTTAGGISFYISKNDAVASDTSQYKVALVTLALSPNPFTAGPFFNQTLDISTGTVFVSAGGADASTAAANFSVWIDALSNTLYATVRGAAPFSVAATLMPVRPAGYAPYLAVWHCTPTASTADVVVDPPPPSLPGASIALFHANRASDVAGGYVNATLARQGLAAALPTVPDAWTGRRFGLALDGGGGGDGCAALARTGPLTLASAAPAACATLRASVRASQGAATDAAWLDELGAQVAAQPRAPPRAAHEAHWAAFWSRAFVDAAGALPAPPARAAAPAPPPGTALWLRAASLAATLPDGAPVSSWADEGGGAALTQANATRAPTLRHDALGPGAPGVVFSEARRTVLAAARGVPLGANASVFAVFRDDGSSGGGAAGEPPCCSGVVSFGDSWAGIATVPAAPGEATDDDGFGPSAGARSVAMADYDGSALHARVSLRGRVVAVGVVYDGGGVAMTVDGCAAAADARVRLAPSPGAVMVGSRGDDKHLRDFEGALGEVLVYARALEPAEVAAVSAYFAAEWGAALPAPPRGCPAPPPFGFAVSQAAAVSRYMNAAQSRVVDAAARGSAQPIKFNGLAWTSRTPGAPTACCSAKRASRASAVAATCDAAPLGPDCRQWGPDNWWQNVRLPYWPMIYDGDWAEHDVVLEYYTRMMPFLTARAAALLPNATPGMLWMTETATVFGAFSEQDYGCGARPAGLPSWLQQNPFICTCYAIATIPYRTHTKIRALTHL
jgi:hypothetical protein